MGFAEYVFIKPLFSLVISLLALYKLILIARIILSWVNPDPYNPVIRLLYTLTEPALSSVRRLLPWRLGPLDLSPVIVLLAVQIVERAISYFLYGLK